MQTPSVTVGHCNQFVFQHQSTPFAVVVSLDVPNSRPSLSILDQNFVELNPMHFDDALRSTRFLFQHRLRNCAQIGRVEAI
jgi:hypothetical protein